MWFVNSTEAPISVVAKPLKVDDDTDATLDHGTTAACTPPRANLTLPSLPAAC